MPMKKWPCLCCWWTISNGFRLFQGFHCILDIEEDGGLKRAECASCADSKRDSRHLYVVRRFP
jgi:hypothetical protein